LYGRKAIVDALVALMLRGEMVLFYGPVGINKTVILEEVRQAVEKENRPCGLSTQTRSLSDLTAALHRAYPAVPSEQDP
jgi:MoxR-like ATPase